MLRDLELLADRPTADYNAQQQHFTQANLNRIGRPLGLEKVLLVGNGLTTVSDGMVADCLKALFGAVKLAVSGLGARLAVRHR